MLHWLDNVSLSHLGNNSSLPLLLLPSPINEAVLCVGCSIKQEKRKDACLYDDSHSILLRCVPYLWDPFFVLYQLKQNCICWMCLDSFSGQDQVNWALGETVILREPVKEQLMDILMELYKWISDVVTSVIYKSKRLLLDWLSPL